MEKKTEYELMCEFAEFFRELSMKYECVSIERDGTVHQYKFLDGAWEDFCQYKERMFR